MKNQFIPESAASTSKSFPADAFDSYDASEERFAASLENKQGQSGGRFVVDERPHQHSSNDCRPANANDSSVSESIAEMDTSKVKTETPAVTGQPDFALSEVEWRQEVAARLSRYRARKRVRSPRYPSLQLKFEVSEPVADLQPLSPPAPILLATAIQLEEPEAPPPDETKTTTNAEPETSAKIIEFPRFFSAPRPILDELAEPVLERLRILEVPEQLPPPPALGGILIETREETSSERRPGFELPLNAPKIKQRLTAAVIDFLIVVLSVSAFATMFFRVTHAFPDLRQTAGISAALMALTWMVYQYLFLVYAGATPGLRLARLQLTRFDGSFACRKLRRWRALASMLSALSLALGYIWFFFDEDRLCWHDRITHTYMALVSNQGTLEQAQR